jgi:WhiB family redox-sensing transcriptional regulator
VIVGAAAYELEPTPWAAAAACAGIDNPSVFFPARGQVASEAQALCATCAVQTQCLDYAVRWRIGHGIWGGLAPRDRRKLHNDTARVRRLPPRHGTTTRYHRGCRCEACTRAQPAVPTHSRPSG